MNNIKTVPNALKLFDFSNHLSSSLVLTYSSKINNADNILNDPHLSPAFSNT